MNTKQNELVNNTTIYPNFFTLMKKLFLCFALVGMTSALCAQEGGDMLVSGSLSWNASSSKETAASTTMTLKDGSSFSILPQFHYFVIDKLSVGGAIGYQFTKTPDGMTADDKQLFNKSGLFVIRPMVSYYISLSEKFYYVPRFYVGVGFGKNKTEISETETTEANATMFQVGLNILNFEFRPTDHIGIMFNAGDLGYRSDISKQDSDNKISNRQFALGLNLGATIGFNYYF